MSHNFRVARLGGGCWMWGLGACGGYGTVDFRNTSFDVTYKKQRAGKRLKKHLGMLATL